MNIQQPLSTSSFHSAGEKVENKAEGQLKPEPPLAMPSDEEWVTLDLKVGRTKQEVSII